MMRSQKLIFSISVLLVLVISAVPILANNSEAERPESFLEPSPATIFTEALTDNSLENGTPNPYWTEYEATFGTPICSVATCSGANEAKTGDWWAWFGGLGGGITSSGNLSQTYLQHSGPTVLSFFVQAPTCSNDPGDTLEVSIDDTIIWDIDATEESCGRTEYTQVMIDITSFGEGTHIVHFDNVMNSGELTNFFIDDVSIDTEPLAITVSEKSTLADRSILIVTVLMTTVLLGITSLKLQKVD